MAKPKAEKKNSKKEQTEDKNFKRVEDVAQFVGRSVRRIQQLTQEGTLPTVETSSGRRYDFVQTIHRYIKHLQDTIDGKTKGNEKQEKDKLEADVRIKEAKAETAELELAELRGEMHRADDVAAFTEDLALNIRQSITSLPGRFAIDLADISDQAEISAKVREEVDKILHELSEYKYDPEYYKERVRERRGWNNNDDEESDED